MVLTFTVRSSEQEIIIFPEQLNAHQVTMSLCPFKSASTIPVEESQSWETQLQTPHDSFLALVNQTEATCTLRAGKASLANHP